MHTDLENHMVLEDFEPVRVAEAGIAPLSAWKLFPEKMRSEYWQDELDKDSDSDPLKSWGEVLMDCRPEDLDEIRCRMKTNIVKMFATNHPDDFSKLINDELGLEAVWELRW